ncbi:methyltransferase domain-containing protein [Actinomadura sp. WAC 06369]|uniref:methyltransferase domain-containing protein n=1 Tax=Actinomadura sp. WAC 06369 TaxID=2203193 RepID=UPI000F778EAC|nr:methyltransferase domain-containing protein [Actinomadura sp. WAC 06369]RSN55650.1 methyltransferase type 11 [Actinomadura sp. WAC 06369]
MTKPTPTEIGQGYDDFAELLDQLWGDNLHHGYWEDESDGASLDEATNRLTGKLAGMLAIEPGARLLDVGCGVGEPAARLVRDHGITAVGISISKRQVERAGERAAAAGLADRLSFEYADAMDLPFPDASFDIVWALESLHHMPDRWHVIRQAARVLRPGGRLAIGDFLLRGEHGSGADAAARVDLVRQGVLKIVDLDEYLSRIREAGLEPEVAEDISDRTRPSWGKSAEIFTAVRDQAVRHIGAEQFERTLSNFRQLSDAPMVGYVLLTARKPA